MGATGQTSTWQWNVETGTVTQIGGGNPGGKTQEVLCKGNTMCKGLERAGRVPAHKEQQRRGLGTTCWGTDIPHTRSSKLPVRLAPAAGEIPLCAGEGLPGQGGRSAQGTAAARADCGGASLEGPGQGGHGDCAAGLSRQAGGGRAGLAGQAVSGPGRACVHVPHTSQPAWLILLLLFYFILFYIFGVRD